MFRATDFTYDGIYSAMYGLKMAAMGGDSIVNSDYVIPKIEVAKPANSKRFFYQNTSYDAPPSYEFTIISERYISDTFQREIMAWLDTRTGFRNLVIHQPEYEEYTYRCILTITNIIYHLGRCIGFNIKATFDSNYMYGKPTRVVVSGNYYDAPITKAVFNYSDILDDYVYPKVTFSSNDLENDKFNMLITNESDNNREFRFDNVETSAEVCVDNELKIITSTVGSNMLSKFNKKWLRLKNGKNVLVFKLNGTITIECPHFAKIRF